MDVAERCDYFGAVVQSTAGRDRYRVFAVVGVTGEAENMRLATADGALRRISTPKLKNPRHVKILGHMNADECKLLSQADDEVLRALLAPYDPKCGASTEICE